MNEAANKKDIWDRVTALAAIFIPATIALAGYLIAREVKQAEISSAQMRDYQAHLIADANTKIAQATLINTMMKSLTSSNPEERKLAVSAVMIALPKEGPALVRAIAESDKDKTVMETAKASLGQRADTLISGLFSEDAEIRKASAQDLIQGWRSDPNVVKSLVKFATQNKGNSNGVYNTIVVLNEFSLKALQECKPEILNFIELAKGVGPSTEAKATALEKRLR